MFNTRVKKVKEESSASKKSLIEENRTLCKHYASLTVLKLGGWSRAKIIAISRFNITRGKW